MAMLFDHEKLDVYRIGLQFATWSYCLCGGLKGLDRSARDQLLRASQSIPLNIAEGNGKRPGADRKRFLQIAYGSALECAAILDVLVACESVTADRVLEGKLLLHRAVAMLIKMTASTDRVCEEEAQYRLGGEDSSASTSTSTRG